MSLRNSMRRSLHRAIFRGPETRLAAMRGWALFASTAVLAVVWKMLIEADKLYGNDFWRAVFGRHPIRNLGWDGLILLAFYLVGAPLWWLVTAWLLEIGAVWRRRMGLRGRGRRAPGRSQTG